MVAAGRNLLRAGGVPLQDERMRTLAVLALLVLVSCASPTAMIDERVLECGPGGDIDVMAGLASPNVVLEGTNDNFTFVVNVANNSHGEITVKTIRVEQASMPDRAGYQLDPAARTFNHAIEEGKDHDFELPMSGRSARSQFMDRQVRRGPIEVRVFVTLTNGDSYRCAFAVTQPG